MNLIGKKVVHIAVGLGEIVKQDENSLDVQFGERVIKLAYPDAFAEGFLKLQIYENLEELQKDIENYNSQKQQREEAGKVCTPRSSKKGERPRLSNTKEKVVYDEILIDLTGASDTILPYFVFQGGDNYWYEMTGGYVWAPLYTTNGQNRYYYDTLAYLRNNYMIFHCNAGEIKAISQVMAPAHVAISPLPDPQYVQRLGRYVKCRYLELNHPLSLKSQEQHLAIDSQKPHSPFNCKGHGNQGYLYELRRELANLFLDEIRKNNILPPPLDKIVF